MALTLHQLKVFETVSRCLSITKASKELHVSQPSVFQQVKFLEEYCGVKLYKKLGRGLGLTHEGMSLRINVLDILHRVDNLRPKFGATANIPFISLLTIGRSHGVSLTNLVRVVAAFKRTHPFVQLSLRTERSFQIEKLILKSEIEIGVVTDPSECPSLFIESYRKKPVVAFCASSYPLAKKRRLTLADLAQLSLIVRRGSLGTRQYLNQIQEKGLKLNNIMEYESAEEVKIATMKALGVGIAFRGHIESELQTGDIKILKISGLRSVSAQSYIIFQRDRPLSTNAQDFLHQLKRLH
jgi:DNA-binding transcriptional LysR family regulator